MDNMCFSYDKSSFMVSWACQASNLSAIFNLKCTLNCFVKQYTCSSALENSAVAAALKIKSFNFAIVQYRCLKKHLLYLPQWAWLSARSCCPTGSQRHSGSSRRGVSWPPWWWRNRSCGPWNPVRTSPIFHHRWRKKTKSWWHHRQPKTMQGRMKYFSFFC